MRARVHICIISTVILALTHGIQGRVVNFPTKFGEFPGTSNEPQPPYYYGPLSQSQTVHDGLEPGEMLFGDMILTQDQVRDKLLSYANQIEGNRWAGMELWVKGATEKWPNGLVPYEKDSSLTPEMSKAVDDALREYHASVCLEFYRRTTETDYVVFTSGSTCRSHLGRKGGVQYITLSNNCHDKVVVMHEMMHAIGREHEHQRYDRDNYVTVNWSNIKNGRNNTAFIIFPRTDYNSQGFHYDIYSIMHYPSWAGIIWSGLINMSPIDTSVSPSDMGAQHPDGTFSAQDKAQIKTFYNCPNGR